MTRYLVEHRTTYRYGARMTGGHSVAHLVPRATDAQTVVDNVIRSEPPADEVVTWLDAFDNLVTYLGVHQPHERLDVVATSEVDIGPPTMPGAMDLAWEDVAGQLAADHSPNGLLARACRLASPTVAVTPAVRAYAVPTFAPGRSLLAALSELTWRIYHDFTFDPAFSDVSTPIDQVLVHRRGVCQDFAHLAIGCLRAVGLPARYVSGYIETEAPPGQPKLVGADASHAWCSAYVPAWGWLDLDPTNDLVAPDRHITVAWGRDYRDVAPVRGVVVGPAARQELSVAVDVTRR